MNKDQLKSQIIEKELALQTFMDENKNGENREKFRKMLKEINILKSRFIDLL